MVGATLAVALVGGAGLRSLVVALARAVALVLAVALVIALVVALARAALLTRAVWPVRSPWRGAAILAVAVALACPRPGRCGYLALFGCFAVALALLHLPLRSRSLRIGA
ncbi:MAG: hypothetical protein ACJ788_23390 [Ktedonobacteraceae bacterium]